MSNLDFYTNVKKRGNHLLVRGIKDGHEVRFKVKYSPTYYTKTNKNSEFKTIYGENLNPVPQESMRDAMDFAKSLQNTNSPVYGFPFPQAQFTLEEYRDSVDKYDKNYIRVFNFDIEVSAEGGFPDPMEAPAPITAISLYDSVDDRFVSFGLGFWDPNESELDPEILEKTVYIECKSEKDLLSKFITYWRKYTPNIITGWNIEGFDLPYLYNRLKNLGFNPMNLSPWSYLTTKEFITPRGLQQRISIFGCDVIDYISIYKKNKVQESYRLDFVSQVELGEKKSLPTNVMLDMSRTPFTDKMSNMAYHDEGDEEFNKFAKVRNERLAIQQSNNANKDLEAKILYKQEKQLAFQAFISYNIQDVNLVKKLDDKMGLLDAQIMIAYEACLNYEDVQSPVRTWDSLINKDLWLNNIIPPYSKPKSSAVHIPGGYVKEPLIGKHGWCISFDLNSLYPHLIMQSNISPETLDAEYVLYPGMPDEERVQKFLNKEEFNSDPKYAVAASGYRFTKEKEGVIPRLMREMYEDRKAFKKQMIQKQKKGQDATREHLKQYVLKILLNSGYGALNNPYFRWFDDRLGKSITLSGQYAIQVAEKSINQWMNKALGTTNKDYIIAIDTDSNYVNFQPLVDKFFSNKTKDEIVDILDKIASEKVQEALNKGYNESADYMNSYDQKMVMEREAIASSAFWTAKKRYAMCVWDMEGVRMPSDKPKIKIQGLEAIRSSTPYVCRKPLLEIIDRVLLDTEESCQKYIKEFKDEFMTYSVEEIAMPRTINNLKKYGLADGFQKGTPPHVRGAIQFNRLLEHHGLQNIWEPIMDGEKGKFLYLKVPNNTKTDVISFTTLIPEEFDISKYVDMEKMFEKVIIDPVIGIFEPLGWSVEKRTTLESFFE